MLVQQHFMELQICCFKLLCILTGERPYSCKLCLKTFTWMNSIRTHLPRVHNIDKDIMHDFIGKVDSAKHHNKLNLIQDSDASDLNEEVIKDEITSDEPVVIRELPAADDDTDIHVDSSIHGNPKFGSWVETNETENYFIKIQTCNFVSGTNCLKNNESLSRKVTYICKTCSKEVGQRSNMTDHVRSHFGVKLFKCKLCGKDLSRKQNLVHHLKYVHYIDSSGINDMIIRNNVAKLPNKTNNALLTSNEQHDVEVANENNYQSQCQRIVSSSHSPNVLQGRHSESEKVKVEACDDMAIGNFDLSKVKIEISDECVEENTDMVRLNIYAIDEHDCSQSEFDHLGESIEIDIKGYDQSNDSEVKVESLCDTDITSNTGTEALNYEVIGGETANEKKYMCKICGFTCGRRYYMTNQHMMKHTGEKRYICVICSKTYTRRYVIRKHIIKEHKIMGEELETVIDASVIDKKKNLVSETHRSHLPETSKIIQSESTAAIQITKLDNCDLGYSEHGVIKFDCDTPQNRKRKLCEIDDANIEVDVRYDRINNIASNYVKDDNRYVVMNETKHQKTVPETEGQIFFSVVPGKSPSGILYKCNLCGFVCTRKYYIENMHILKHTCGKPYICVVCSKSYSQKHILRSHLVKEHDIEGKELEDLMNTKENRIETGNCKAEVASNSDIEVNMSYDRYSYPKPKRGELSSLTSELSLNTLLAPVEQANVGIAIGLGKQPANESLELLPEFGEISRHSSHKEEFRQEIETQLDIANEGLASSGNTELPQILDRDMSTHVFTSNDVSLLNSTDEEVLDDDNLINGDQITCQNSGAGKQRKFDKRVTGTQKLVEDLRNTTDPDVYARKGILRQRARTLDHRFDDMMDIQTLTCLKCNKKCSKKSNLKQHIRILHFNLKEYTCQKCHKTFNTKYNLKIHMKQHMDPEDRNLMNYICSVCSKAFTTKSYVKFHMAKYHGLGYESKMQNDGQVTELQRSNTEDSSTEQDSDDLDRKI